MQDWILCYKKQLLSSIFSGPLWTYSRNYLYYYSASLKHTVLFLPFFFFFGCVCCCCWGWCCCFDCLTFTGLCIFSPPLLYPWLFQLFRRMPSISSIVISVVDKSSLFSTQTQKCILKRVCICSLFQSTSVLKFPLLIVFMWFFSYRNDYCQVSGECSCATAPFSACVTRTS